MAKVSQSEFLERFRTGVANAGTKFQKGVEQSEDWAARYSSTDAQTRMAQGLQEAIASGKPAEGARALGTAGWRARTKEKAGNYTGAAQRAADNMAPYAAQILAAGDAAKAAAQAVTGPKSRDTAKRKVSAALDAIMDQWGRR